MAFVADTRMIANCWLRPGNTASANNVSAFLDSTLTKLTGKRIGLLRADSGFSDNAFLCKLEAQNTSHIIALCLNQPLQRALVDATGWWTIDDGIDLVSVQYQVPTGHIRGRWLVSGNTLISAPALKVKHSPCLLMIQLLGSTALAHW
ncbi:MAG: hypothetical protein Q8Q76_06210 [Methylotenera sp.]|nr:hypothetical protein [Methylotenera sp.]